MTGLGWICGVVVAAVCAMSSGVQAGDNRGARVGLAEFAQLTPQQTRRQKRCERRYRRCLERSDTTPPLCAVQRSMCLSKVAQQGKVASWLQQQPAGRIP